ncbi:MAG: hypothetical protein PHI58_01660 [Candidatus Omnitrophica bacterium]|nr:hypothetical protein [Candidatus Omnitrophota bacterium]
MKFNKNIIVSVFALTLISAFLFTAGTVNAQDESVNRDEISVKLDQVLSNQKMIMAQIESLKQELTIVKIRVTQQQ